MLLSAPGEPSLLSICVVGAGNLGQAQAGHLAALGHSVRLYNRGEARLRPLRAAGAIRLSGALAGTHALALLTTDLGLATLSADLVFLDVPGTAHAGLALSLAALLGAREAARGPLIVLHPGQTFGARHLSLALRRAGLAEPPPIVELQTALYTARQGGAGEATVLAQKDRVAMATYPSTALARGGARVAGQVRVLRALYPQLIPAPTTLHTGLTNLQGFFHPILCLHNLARIDRGERFSLYREGASPALGDLLGRADLERLSVARALGVTVPTAAQWFGLSYGATGETAFEAMRRVSAYDGLSGPTSLATRLLWEDVPTGLVPLLALARALSVETPVLTALSAMVVAVCGPGILEGAWTLDALELAGSAQAIREAF